MANSQSLVTALKVDLMLAKHAFGATVVRGATTKDTFNGALILASSSFGASTAAYTGTPGSVAMSGEASGTGYTAGGAAITNATAPTSTGTTGFWTPSASLSWSGLTLASAVDALYIYNLTTSGYPGVGVFTFGSLTITAGTLTIAFPVNDASTGLVRIA